MTYIYGQTKPSLEDALAHHGVKGMHWGERKDYKIAVKTGNQIAPQVHARQEAQRLRATLTEEQFNKLSEHDVVISKGSVLKRTTANPDDASLKTSLYVSTNERDANNYRAIIPGEGDVLKKYNTHYETTLVAREALKSPSEKTRVAAYIKLMDENSIKLNSGESINGREYLRRAGLGDTVDKLDSKQLALTYYGQLTVNQGIRNEPLNTAYFNSLNKRGYNAIIDDNDRSIFGDQPLLVLNASKSLQTVGVKQLSDNDIHKSVIQMQLPPHKP